MSLKSQTDITDLPGEELIRDGLAQIDSGEMTVTAALAWIAHARLIRHGLLPKGSSPPPAEPERLLYRLLQQSGPDAYARYNALLRTLTSFERALDHRRARATSQLNSVVA